MPTSIPSSDLTLADLPEDVREEGARLKAQYHALASDAGLLTERGAVDLGKLGDIDTVKQIDLTTLRALAETAEALQALGGLSPDALQRELVRLGLGAKLERSIADTIAASTRAYDEGPYGFTPDPSTLRVDKALLPRLQLGLESGALNGLVLTAYPTLMQITVIARRLQKDPEELLNMPVTEFLIEHFAARGGTVDAKVERVEMWKKLRWARPGTRTIGQRLLQTSRDDGVDPATQWLDANGARSPKYKGVHTQVYQDLPVQQTLRDVAGTSALTFTNVTKNPPDTAKLLTSDAVSPQVQGDGLSFMQLAHGDIDSLNPAEFLAYVSTFCDPTDVGTYPDRDIWEWLSGLFEDFAPDGDSDSGGLLAGWNGPEHSLSNGRARPVVR